MAKKIIILLFCFPLLTKAQTVSRVPLQSSPKDGFWVRTIFYQGDTIPYIVLPVFVCSADRVFKNKRQAAQWDRLKYNVKKVYPYAILAAAKLKEYDRLLSQLSEKDRKKYTKLVEDQLKKEFSDELKKFSVNQGRILIKLIDRETGKTTYDVVKDMRGSFSAFMWQSLALLFDSNLKYHYDPEGDDKAIEQAIKMIENGEY